MQSLLFLPLLLAALASAEETKKNAPKKPIISTDLIHGTGELIYDIYDAAYRKLLKPHVDKHGKTVSEAIKPVTDFLDFDKDGSVELEDSVGHVCSKVGCKHTDVMNHIDTAHKTAKSSVETAASTVHEHLTAGTHKVVDQFEKALPSHTGMIRRTPGNLLLFCLLIVSILYMLIKVALISLRISWKVFIFSLKTMLCCGCCGLLCRKRGAATPNGKQKQTPNGNSKANGNKNNSKKSK
eukprot:TRINITY_DN14079_c0_g1_i1.p1 TRINITY_DN14079_c0_g1~~TRINITY_DN14079_c0_g1_i1.p1  ORF type:complete len:239 (+),score=51.50 TRINITY_DN14079_c0_g1_i1:81-797(+)